MLTKLEPPWELVRRARPKTTLRKGETAWPYFFAESEGQTAPRCLLRDRDRIFGTSFRKRVRDLRIQEVLIGPRSPWQSPYVERVIGIDSSSRLRPTPTQAKASCVAVNG
jgi:hypothetical protein